MRKLSVGRASIIAGALAVLLLGGWLAANFAPVFPEGGDSRGEEASVSAGETSGVTSTTP